ncbi:uncharacterized protein EAF01_000472 [Botrytis porri]|uniref:uncharacterized protein n=1 Tax=Botrytis porri TaxID=87229 RepID=UPI0018FFA403|nr:uncharacterized protein EAF01_000472 [Botrytis porri]KAF7914066.1 hypothetical protein EAF01_000472 [Botrytis porri]
MIPSNLKHIPRSLSKSSSPFSRAISISISTSSPMPAILHSRRQFASTASKKDQNRIYSPIRYPPDLSTYISLSTSTSKPLLTLWTTSYCSTCKTLSPLLHQILESGVGEKEGGVLFAEVEYDAPDIMNEGLGMRYLVRSVPSLVGFWRGEVMGEGEGGRLGSREIAELGREGLEEWIRGAARRGREWREGHPGGEGLFGGLWKGWGK